MELVNGSPNPFVQVDIQDLHDFLLGHDFYIALDLFKSGLRQRVTGLSMIWTYVRHPYDIPRLEGQIQRMVYVW